MLPRPSSGRAAKNRGLEGSIWSTHQPGSRLSSASSLAESRLERLTTTTASTTTTTTTTTTDSSLLIPFPPSSFADRPPGGKLSPGQELSRYSGIVRRLKWKLPFLALGYRRAIEDRSDGGLASEHVYGPDLLANCLADPVEAEMMFKLDFFEFYMLLERALVHLLGVFDIVVSAGRDRLPLRSGYSHHAYHSNVLSALDAPSNPLHECLGRGLVRRSLARAKELRNRWKFAGDEAGGGDTTEALSGYGGQPPIAPPPPPLESYDIDPMLRAIFDGFDCAYNVARDFVVSLDVEMEPVELETGLAGNAAYTGNAEAADKAEARQWDFMVEAMDWEAV